MNTEKENSLQENSSFLEQTFLEENQLPGIDHLTGLADRNILHRWLYAMCNQKIPFAFLLADIENFALFNQELDPVQADQILKRFAAFLKQQLKPGYKIGRWQGNCFALILPQTNLHQGEGFIYELKEKLAAAPWQIKELPLAIHTAIACCPPGDISTLVNQAEYQLEKEKQQKKIPAWIDAQKPSLQNQLLLAFLTTRDNYYQKFILKTMEIALQMGKQLEMGQPLLEQLQTAVLWQDTGMAEISGQVLLHPGPLPEKYWQVIKRHPLHSSIIAEKMGLPEGVVKAVLYHHEKWDGSGYPHHLKGTEIPLLARILQIAGSWSAMQFPRPYRKQLSHSAALDEIYSGRNKAFDPHLVSVFRNAIL